MNEKERAKEASRRFGPGADNSGKSIADILIEIIETDTLKRRVVGGKIYHLHPSEAKECLRKEMNGNTNYFFEKYGTEFY